MVETLMSLWKLGWRHWRSRHVALVDWRICTYSAIKGWVCVKALLILSFPSLRFTHIQYNFFLFLLSIFLVFLGKRPHSLPSSTHTVSIGVVLAI
jgi:hypothetical protein